MNIKDLRQKCRLTQEELSVLLQIQRSTIAKWETGKAKPRVDKLPQLAKIFGCTIDELFS